MQTFLPFADFKASAESLDRQRLGKQRVEVKQIFNTLRKGGAWSNHPAVRMWRRHEYHLLLYGMVICNEWRSRGYEDSLYYEFKTLIELTTNIGPPEWIGNEYVHRSHRSNLIRKFPSHYRDTLHWQDPPDLAYFWPQ